jgi:glycosyltransferase involved in cell wall biosynthesis
MGHDVRVLSTPTPDLSLRSITTCILIPAFNLGGTERQAIELLRGLEALSDADRGEVVVVVLREGGELWEAASATGFPIHSLGHSSMLAAPRTVVRWIRMVRRLRPVAVYSLLSPTNFMAAATRPIARPERLVWGIRDDQVGAERRGLGRIVAIVGTRVLARLTDLLIVNSDAVRQGVRAGGVTSVRIEVIPNGIDAERFRPDLLLRRTERTRLGLSNEPLVVCVARLVPKKNHSMLLRAFAHVHESMPDARLYCFGDGPEPYRRELQALLERLGLKQVAHLEPSREDPEAVFNAADLAVLASNAEGFPNTIAEALACGTPCVSTAVGSAPELLDPQALVAPGDVAGFADAMHRALRKTDADVVRRSLLSTSFNLGALARRTLSMLSSG